jgi:hypothetical protein
VVKVYSVLNSEGAAEAFGKFITNTVQERNLA